MGRKKKTLAVFVISFLLAAAFWIWGVATNWIDMSMEDAIWNGISFSILCALMIAVTCWFFSVLSSVTNKNIIIDENSLPTKLKDGAYVFKNIFLIDEFSNKIFGKQPIIAYLYQDKIIFKSLQEDPGQKSLTLMAGNIELVEFFHKKEIKNLFQKVPFWKSFFQRFIYHAPPAYESAQKMLEVGYIDIKCMSNNKKYLIRVQDSGNGLCKRFYEKMNKMQIYNCKEVNANCKFSEENIVI